MCYKATTTAKVSYQTKWLPDNIANHTKYTLYLFWGHVIWSSDEGDPLSIVYVPQV